MSTPTTTPGTAVSRPADGAVPRRPGMALRLLRGFSGALAWGLVALAVLLAVAQWMTGDSVTVPGPGAGTLAGHGTGAAVAVTLQRGADRSRGWRAVASAFGVIAVAAVVLWLWWWR